MIADNVKDSDKYTGILRCNPGVVVVATAGVDLRSRVHQDDAWRVIQTETTDGWLHVLKQLRPPEALIPATLTELVPEIGLIVPFVKDSAEILHQYEFSRDQNT